MSGISISKIDWDEHHTLITTDTATGFLDVFVFLSQFKVLPTTLASLRESSRVAVSRTMTNDQLRQACKAFREAHPETLLFEEIEEDRTES